MERGSTKNKIFSREELSGILEKRKAAGDIVAFTNGCFDIIHVGHVRYLYQAALWVTCWWWGLTPTTRCAGIKVPKGR